MEKRRLKAKQKTRALALGKETLRQLERSDLQRVAGAGRIRIPVGFAEDTSPTYSEEDQS